MRHRVTPTHSDAEATLLMEQGYLNFDGTPNEYAHEIDGEDGLDLVTEQLIDTYGA